MTWLKNPKVQFWIALLFPVIAVLIAYAPIYNGPFIWDDSYFLVKWEMLHDPSKYGELLKGALPEGHAGGYRPLRTLYEALSAQVFKANPTPYHIQAVIFHAITTGIVFFILLKLFELFPFHAPAAAPKLSKKERKKLRHLSHPTPVSSEPVRDTTLYTFLASLGAILFGLHPVMQSSVAFIQANFDAMGITYALISYYLFLRTIDESKNKIFFTVGSACFAFISFAFFELTYPLPIILFITSFLFVAQKKSLLGSCNTSILASLPSFILLGIILFIRVFLLNLTASRPSASPEYYFTFLAATRGLFAYIFQTLFPIHLAAIHEIAPGITTIGADTILYFQLKITDPQTILAFMTVFGTCIFAVTSYKKMPLLVLGSLWFFTGLLPVMNIFVHGAIYSERYLYFSIVGFAIAMTALVKILIEKMYATHHRHLLLISLILCIGILYGIRTFVRVNDWNDPIHFWEKEANNLPLIGRIRNLVGEEYLKKGQVENSIREFRKGIELDPFDSGSYNGLALALYRNGDFNNAKDFAERALMLFPEESLYFRTLQTIYTEIDDPEHKFQFYSSLLERNTKSPGLYYIHGVTAFELGHTATAEASLRKATELNPNGSQIYAAFGTLLLKVGRPNEAKDILEAAIKRGLSHPQILYNLVITYRNIGDIESAKGLIRQIMIKNPSDPAILKLYNELEASDSGDGKRN